MLYRYFLVTSVVCQKFIPKQCVVCWLGFFSSMVLYFCLNVFGFLTFAANRIVFSATCSIRFSIFLSIVLCTPFYPTLCLFSASSIGLECAPVSGCVGEYALVSVLGSDLCVTLGGDPFFCICTSSSDHRLRSCITSAGRGGFVRFFQSKHACFALSQFRLFGELFVAIFDSGVFGFLPICASKGENFVTPCGVILSNFIISATSEANLYGVFVWSIFITANLRLIV